MKERKGNSPLLHKITVPLQTLLDSLKSRELTLFVRACLRQDGLFLPTQFTVTLFFSIKLLLSGAVLRGGGGFWDSSPPKFAQASPKKFRGCVLSSCYICVYWEKQNCPIHLCTSKSSGFSFSNVSCKIGMWSRFLYPRPRTYTVVLTACSTTATLRLSTVLRR